MLIQKFEPVGLVLIHSVTKRYDNEKEKDYLISLGGKENVGWGTVHIPKMASKIAAIELHEHENKASFSLIGEDGRELASKAVNYGVMRALRTCTDLEVIATARSAWGSGYIKHVDDAIN